MCVYEVLDSIFSIFKDLIFRAYKMAQCVKVFAAKVDYLT